MTQHFTSKNCCQLKNYFISLRFVSIIDSPRSHTKLFSVLYLCIFDNQTYSFRKRKSSIKNGPIAEKKYINNRSISNFIVLYITFIMTRYNQVRVESLFCVMLAIVYVALFFLLYSKYKI